jgi:methionyl-tRNA synthetase
MLISAGLPLPRRIVVHGFMTLEGQRISKTTGNTIAPVQIVDEFGADAVRYYIMREMTFTSDGDFSRANLVRRHNNDLGNDLGNLLNRVVSMIGRYRDGNVPTVSASGDPEREIRETAEMAVRETGRLIENWELDDALVAIWALLRRANQYLEERKPWALAKDSSQASLLDTVLWTAAEATRIAGILIAPYMPETANRIMDQLGLPPVVAHDWTDRTGWGSVDMETLNPQGPLFPRIEVETDA